MAEDDIRIISAQIIYEDEQVSSSNPVDSVGRFTISIEAE